MDSTGNREVKVLILILKGAIPQIIKINSKGPTKIKGGDNRCF